MKSVKISQSFTQRYNGRHYVNHWWFINLLRGALSIPDAMSCDDQFYHMIYFFWVTCICFIHNFLKRETEDMERNKRTKQDNLIAIFKIKYCFTFVSDHNTDSLMLYSGQLKNMHSYLNSSLKLSDKVRGISCQPSYCNLISLY